MVETPSFLPSSEPFYGVEVPAGWKDPAKAFERLLRERRSPREGVEGPLAEFVLCQMFMGTHSDPMDDAYSFSAAAPDSHAVLRVDVKANRGIKGRRPRCAVIYTGEDYFDRMDARRDMVIFTRVTRDASKVVILGWHWAEELKDFSEWIPKGSVNPISATRLASDGIIVPVRMMRRPRSLPWLE